MAKRHRHVLAFQADQFWTRITEERNCDLFVKIIELFLTKGETISSLLCLSEDKLGDLIESVIGYKERYKLRMDLIRLGIFQEFRKEKKTLKRIDLIREGYRVRGGGRNYLCCADTIQQNLLAKLMKLLKYECRPQYLIAYTYNNRGNRVLTEWLDTLYTNLNVEIKRAREIIMNILVSRYYIPQETAETLIPRGERFKEKLLKPLARISDGIIRLRDEKILVDAYRFYSEIISGLRGPLKVRISLHSLIKAYVEFLKERNLYDEWLKSGYLSINLYELWKEKFSNRIEWNDFVAEIRRIAAHNPEIHYMYYFIYSDDRAHRMSIAPSLALRAINTQ